MTTDDNDWQPRPAIYPGEWLDEETSAQAVREFDDLRRHTVQPGDNANRLAKQEQARKTAELALADMRAKYWEDKNWIDLTPIETVGSKGKNE